MRPEWISLHSSAPSPSPLPCNHQPLSLCFNLILIPGDKDNTLYIEIGKGEFSSIVTQIELAATWFPSDDGDTSTSCRSPLNSSPSSASLALSKSGSQIRCGWNHMESSEFGLVRFEKGGYWSQRKGEAEGEGEGENEAGIVWNHRSSDGSKKKVGDYRGGGRGGFIFDRTIYHDG